MTAWFLTMLRHRIAVLLLLLLVSILAASSASNAVFGSSIRKIFFGQDPAYERYLEQVSVFGNDTFFVVGWDDPTPLEPQDLAALRQAVDGAEAHPEVRAVHSLLSAPWVRMEDGALRADSYADAAEGDVGAAGVAAATAALHRDPLIRGVFVDQLGTATAVVVELEVNERTGEDGPQLTGEVLDAFVAAGMARESLHTAGFPISMAEAVRQSYVNVTQVLPATLLLLALTVFVVFRRLLPVFITAGVALISVLWTMGFATALDPQLSLFMTVTPGVVLIVAFADVVHLYSAYLTELEHGRADPDHDPALLRERAILASAGDVGTACVFTSVTTFVGFVSLSFVPTPVFQTLGLVLGFGVAVALLLAMTLTPIVLSWLPAPEPPRRDPAGRGVAVVLDTLQGWATRRSGLVLGLWAVVIVAAVVGLTRVDVESDVGGRLSDRNSVTQDAHWFGERFSGTTSVEVFVHAAEGEDVMSPELLSALAGAEAELEARADVDRVTSLADVLGTVHSALGGEGPLPASREAIAQELLLFELSGGGALDGLLDFERRATRMTLTSSLTGFRATHRLSQEVEAILREHLGPDLLAQGVQVEATGIFPLLGWWLDRILLGQKTGFAFSFLVIAGLMSLALRSIRVGLWSMLPNLLPVLCLGGFAGLWWTHTDSDTFIIGMLAIGIGVDDTIHFLVRYRLEAGRTDDTSVAISRTFAFAGRAIVVTTLILVVGFLPFALTDYFTTWMFGTLLPMVLVVALMADLLLVPAMVTVGLMRLAPGQTSTSVPSAGPQGIE